MSAPASRPQVRFGATVCPAEPGKDLLGLLLDAQARITYACMSGSCGTCRVRIRAGTADLAPKTDAEHYHCTAAPDDRLACQAVCLGTGDIVVEQP